MKLAIVLGGSGYIGTFLIKRLIEDRAFDRIVIFDLKPPGPYRADHPKDAVTFVKGDVRSPIVLPGLGEVDRQNSWIFNLAAVHREPGHEFREYFDTNIPGAEHANRLARDTGIQNIFFTSSIAPYGKAWEERSEESPLYPETAYGISKALAEKIHGQWLAEHPGRRLIIVRPSVIYGPHDPGNVYRMIRALKRGTFVLPNGGDIVKAYGYIYGLVDSIRFTMGRNDRQIIYNYAENPLLPLKDMAAVVKDKLAIKKPVMKLPVRLLALIAGVIRFAAGVTGKKTDIHPVRVRKAGFPTHIKPAYLIDNGFDFRYGFERSLDHWQEIAPEDFEADVKAD